MFASGLVGRAASCLAEALLGCYPGIYCAVILIKAFECWQVSIVRGDVWLIAYFFVTAINRMLWGCMLDSKQFPLEWDEQMDLGAISAFHLECEIGEKPKLHWPFNVLLKDVIGWKKKKSILEPDTMARAALPVQRASALRNWENSAGKRTVLSTSQINKCAN